MGLVVALAPVSIVSSSLTRPYSCIYPIENHGELAFVLCCVFPYLTVASGRRLRVDAARRA
jgi:hypothetical protein